MTLGVLILEKINSSTSSSKEVLYIKALYCRVVTHSDTRANPEPFAQVGSFRLRDGLRSEVAEHINALVDFNESGRNSFEVLRISSSPSEQDVAKTNLCF